MLKDSLSIGAHFFFLDAMHRTLLEMVSGRYLSKVEHPRSQLVFIQAAINLADTLQHPAADTGTR